ncbi:MAG: glycosyltransferase [Myxococcota bacterium]
MKVCTICDDLFPSYWTSTNQVVTTASSLGKVGVDVDLMIPILISNLFKSREKRLRELCEFYGVEPTFNLKDVFTVMPTNKFRIEKLTHGMLAPLLARLDDYDLIYTRHVLPVVLSIYSGGKAMFETYRLLPEEFPRTIPLIRKIAHHPNFLGITTHSELSSNAFIEAGVPEEKVISLHNGFDPEEFEPRLSKTEARKLLGLPEDGFYATYTGHMTSFKGTEIFIDIAKHAPDVQFLLIGGPTEKEVEHMKALARENNLDNVKIMGWLKPHLIPPYLYASDVLMIPPTDKPLKLHGRTVLPIKIFNYLAAGRVIFAPDLADTEEILHHGVNSFKVQPNNPQKAAAALDNIAADPLMANNIAEKALQDSKKYTWNQRAFNLKEFMEKRLKASR